MTIPPEFSSFRIVPPHRLRQSPIKGYATRPLGRGKLAPYRAFIEELVVQDPDITLYELRDALAMAEGVQVHHSSIAALLKRLGFSYKKNRWWPLNSTVFG